MRERRNKGTIIRFLGQKAINIFKIHYVFLFCTFLCSQQQCLRGLVSAAQVILKIFIAWELLITQVDNCIVCVCVFIGRKLKYFFFMNLPLLKYLLLYSLICLHYCIIARTCLYYFYVCCITDRYFPYELLFILLSKQGGTWVNISRVTGLSFGGRKEIYIHVPIT